MLERARKELEASYVGAAAEGGGGGMSMAEPIAIDTGRAPGDVEA
jgi:hypothetical protein